MSIYVAVRDLPATLRGALDAVGYRKADVRIEARDTYVLQDWGMAGSRAFTCAVDLATGARRVTYGSWGGPNGVARG